MGFNDHSHHRANLPPEAGDYEAGPFEPNDDWIKGAPEEQQFEAMREWFHARYEDPANETPYDSEDGYQFIWGGPYDPSDVIQERFSHVVTFEVMEKLIDELLQEAGDEWAPIEHEGLDYDDELSFRVLHRSDPLQFLTQRLGQVDAVLALNTDFQTSELVNQMAHSSIIAALEAFLAETMAYWVTNDRKVLQQFVACNKDFKLRTLTLDQVFNRLDHLEEEVKLYLQEMIWHRLDKVKPIMQAGLEITIPEIGELMKEVVIRHDIVHRAGRTKDGTPVSVSSEDVRRVRGLVIAFAGAIETELEKRFPAPEETEPF
jgi:hypothetical protein